MMKANSKTYCVKCELLSGQKRYHFAALDNAMPVYVYLSVTAAMGAKQYVAWKTCRFSKPCRLLQRIPPTPKWPSSKNRAKFFLLRLAFVSQSTFQIKIT